MEMTPEDARRGLFKPLSQYLTCGRSQNFLLLWSGPRWRRCIN